MSKRASRSMLELATEEGAAALLAATYSYLLGNDVPPEFILRSAREHCAGRKAAGGRNRAGKGPRRKGRRAVGHYAKFIQAYEDMGMVMSAWYSLPGFLDGEGRPLPLTAARGPRSIAALVRASRVKISAAEAALLMQQSPSVAVDAAGNYVALKRVFFLPNFEIPRAALVIERYLDTLRKNSTAHRKGTMLLLERNCHVPEIDLARLTRILRDIKGRGTAFMDSIDSDIEAHRARKAGRRGVGELGVFVFAWTRQSKTR